MAIGPGRKLQVTPGIRAGEISDERVRNIVRSSAFIREMKLPQILEMRRFLDGIPGRGRSAFSSAIVHDGHARSDAVEKERAIAGDRAVMGNDVDVNWAKLIDGAHQQHFLV